MCWSIISIAQKQYDKDILIDGVIINKENKEPMPFVHVMNVNTEQGTASNLQGRFTIKMGPKDSLVFSAVGFDNYAFTLNKGIDASRLDITIELNTATLELEPVKIFAYRDERAFKQAILDLKVEPEPGKQRIELPGFYYGPRKEVPVTILSPVSYFSKAEREKRKYQKLETKYDEWRENVFVKYNPQVVREITGLPDEEVDDFMKYCKLDENFIRLSTEYDVVVAIHKCLEKYQTGSLIELDK